VFEVCLPEIFIMQVVAYIIYLFVFDIFLTPVGTTQRPTCMETLTTKVEMYIRNGAGSNLMVAFALDE